MLLFLLDRTIDNDHMQCIIHLPAAINLIHYVYYAPFDNFCTAIYYFTSKHKVCIERQKGMYHNILYQTMPCHTGS